MARTDSSNILLPDSVPILGIRLRPLTLDGLLSVVDLAVHRRKSLDVFYANVHTMNLAAGDSEYADLLNSADVIYCDGTGVRFAGRLLGVRLPQRMTGADWIHDLAHLCVAHEHSLFLLGGAKGVAEEAARKLQRDHPGLRVVGARDGYALNEAALDQVRASNADILLVGMGSPRQERWIRDHRDGLDVPVVWAVGALFDFVSGRLARGPRWMTENGLEWLCRLAVEPRKLWRRYLIGNPRFMWRVLRAMLREHPTSNRDT